MKLILFGSGGHAESSLDLAVSLNYQVVGCIDPMSTQGAWNDIPVFRSFMDMNSDHPKAFLLGIGNISIRNRVVRETLQYFPDAVFPTLIHPTAHVSTRAKIGAGSNIFARSYIGPQVIIGMHCLINTASCIEHNSTFGDHVVLSPGAMVGGEVGVGSYSMIGIGAVISNRVKIGKESVIGGNSFVNKDIPENVVAYGSPARIIRKSEIN
jgi:sugar O-acyltransferase (sialic acid O-acetyltransferase NeuD family)